MEIDKFTTGFYESLEVLRRCHKRNPCQRLLQVGGKPFAIVWTVQQAIDIEEDIFMRHFGTVFFTYALKNELAYTGMPSIILVSLVKLSILESLAKLGRDKRVPPIHGIRLLGRDALVASAIGRG